MVDSTELKVASPQLGDWTFILFGVGRVPTMFDPVDLFSEVGTLRNRHVSFRNPFKKEIRVRMTLEGDLDGIRVISPNI